MANDNNGNTPTFDLDAALADAGIEMRPAGMPDWNPRPKPQPQGDAEGPGFFRTAIEQDWAHAAIGRIYEDSGFEFDAAYALEDVPQEDWKRLTNGIPEEFHETLGNARSRDHLDYLAQRLRESVEREATLAQYGAWGIAGRFATALTDPSAWLLALSTGGGSIASRGERLINAARASRRAGDFAKARSALAGAETASATGTIARTAITAGAENAVLESVLTAGDDTKDAWDVGYAGLAGLTIGGAAGKLLSGRELRQLHQAAIKERALMEVAELDARMADKRKEVLGRLEVPPEQARQELWVLDGEAAAFRARYERPVVGAYSPEYRRALESGGKADAKNPESSAYGADQFIGETWLNTVKQAKPEWAAGLSDRSLLALRADPEKSGEMAAFLDQASEAHLRSKGAEVNRHSMYAAHHFGPAKAVAFAKADGDTPMADILTAGQMKANPYLKGKTKAEAIANWDERAAKAGVQLQDGVRLADEAPAMRDRARGPDVDNIDEPAVGARLADIEAQLSAPKVRPLAAEVDAIGAREATDPITTTGPQSAPEVLTVADFDDAALRGNLEAERGRLVEALGLRSKVRAAAPTRAVLAELDEVDKVRAGATTAHSMLSRGAPVSYVDKETLSAARTVGVVEDVHETLAPKSAEMPRQSRMQFAGATKLIGGTFSGVLRGHANAKIRSTLGRLVGNSIGNEDGSAVAVGASEVQARLSESMAAKFYSSATPAYTEWADRNGHGLFARQTRKVRDEFMDEVGRTVRGEIADSDPAVAKLAAKASELFKEFLTEARAAGVKGFENVEENPNYLPRAFNFYRLGMIEDEVGTEGLGALIRGAIKAANDDMGEELVATLAGAYVKKLKGLRVGSDAHLLAGVRWDDVGFLRQFLTDAGHTADEVESVVGKFALLNESRARQQEGSLRYAKRRMNLDESFEMELPAVVNGVKQVKRVRVSDILENNVESLFQRYARSVSGHVGLAKVGIKSRADFDAMIREAENELAGDLDDLKRVKEFAEVAYKLVTGHPVAEVHALSRIGRTIRDWNFTTTMNQAGFAQIPDLASMLSKGYLRYTLSNLSYAVKAMRRKDGTLDDEFAREMEEWLGVGTDYHNNAVFASYDYAETDFDKGVSKIGHTARVLGRGTQALSGMAFITSMTQRLAAKAIVMRLTKEVTEGGALNARRVADLGLDREMAARISQQIKAHSTLLDNEAEGHTKIVNWHGWDDIEARDAMLNAVFREARRLVQEEDLGDTAKWMHGNLGKMLAQFRRFALVAYTKQTLHGIAHQDAETYTRAIVSMGLAALAYQARWELRLAQMEAGGTDQEKLEEMRAEHLSWDRLAAASWANSTYASLSPVAIDTLSTRVIGQSFFDTRTSGLEGDILTGNPTMRTVKGVQRAAQSVWEATARDDRQLTQSDARAVRALMPYQNLLGMDLAFSALTADLPEQDEDDDRESLDWVYN
jgi:hypothetical protein